MKLITFATFEEAKSTLETCDAKEIDNNLFKSSIGLIAITGIGSFAAYFAVKNIQEPFDSIINIGLAGSGIPSLQLGTIYQVSRCSKYNWHPKGAHESTFAPLDIQKTGFHLSTFDFPVYNSNKSLELVDMEGYGIALSAKNLNKPCKLYKLVSDYCNEQSSSNIKDTISKYSQIICNFLT